MKSSLTYDMHNYAAKSPTPKIMDVNSSKNYSLRQRQKKLRHNLEESLEYNSDISNNDNEPITFSNTYELDKPKKSSKKHESNNSSKPKTKAAPLSKYRRKTANARERTRMREINLAFENLRYCVPTSLTGEDSGTTNEKLTKITTLRLAMKYIRILDEALVNPSFEADFIKECQKDGDHRFTTANWIKAPPPVIEQTYDSNEDLDSDVKSPVAKTKSTKSCAPKTNATKRTQNNTARKTTATSKRQTKKQKLPPIETTFVYSPMHTSNESTSTSAYASFSSAAVSPASTSFYQKYDNASLLATACQSMSDFGSSLVLDSDGESLHLSDQCLSPKNFASLLDDHVKINESLHGYDLNSNMVSMENPLELSLRLLESASADSLEYSGEPQPPSCISPLVTMDPFNPFGDLLHADYVEQNSLDMFLT